MRWSWATRSWRAKLDRIWLHEWNGSGENSRAQKCMWEKSCGDPRRNPVAVESTSRSASGTSSTTGTSWLSLR
eukprot:8940448-Pyramimonas_sp.AAC.1